MKIAPVAEVKAKLSEFIDESHNGAVIITKNGRPTAAIVPIDSEEDLERIVLSRSKVFQKIITDSEKRIKKGKSIDHEEFWNSLESESAPPKKRKKRNDA